jgi:hypothetical protein
LEIKSVGNELIFKCLSWVRCETILRQGFGAGNL